MAQDKYIVLRTPGNLGARVLAGAAAREEELRDVEVKLETVALTEKEARDQRRDPAALMVAPRMPVKLVKPKQRKKAPAAATIAWGVRAVGADVSPFDGDGVTVAVLDTGIKRSHEAFKAFKGDRLVEKDFSGDGNGDRDGHGTHCAGTIFGGVVDGVRIGVAPNVSRVLVGKVLNDKGEGGTDQIADGLFWAAREGANVISMSIGFDFTGMVKELMADGLKIEPATSIALTAYRDNVRLFDRLASLVLARADVFAKCLVIAASGNESERPKFVIATAPPAAADGIFSVGAVGENGASDRDLVIADFSNGAPDLSGPGVEILSASLDGGLEAMDGTSMATPHVAGVAALWFQRAMKKNPRFQVSQIEGQLIGSCDPDAIARDQDLGDVGAGLVKAPKE
jgi:subtilisin family serine protease